MKAVERPESMNPPWPGSRPFCQFFQMLDCARILLLHQEPLSGETPPNIRICQVMNELFDRCLVEGRQLGPLESLGNDSPDAAPAPAFEVQTFLDVFGKRKGR